MDEMVLEKIRKVPDFPKPGILFYDLTTVMQDPISYGLILESLAKPYERKKVELVVSVEARGFIFGSAVANDLGAGFVPVRKPGKLPWKTVSESYDLEYGQDTLELHQDAIRAGQRVLIVDDLLATGGTAAATLKMLRGFKADIVGAAFVMELKALEGRRKLEGVEIHSLMQV